jgi:hypothetical protein
MARRGTSPRLAIGDRAMLKAIETKYKGYRFRSRLEARWAVFFDALGVTWEYEKEGYDLGDAGWYLPDFWLPDMYDRNFNRGMWAEIKGQEPTEIENQRCEFLAEQTRQSVVLFVGVPHTQQEGWSGANGGNGHYQWAYKASDPSGAYWDNWMRLHWCSNCYVAKIEFENNYYSCPVCGKQTCTSDDPKIDNAVIAARSARFEHGEHP